MKRVFVGIAVAVTLFHGTASQVSAAVPDVYTNDNFFQSEHDIPVSFVQDVLGNFSGTTTSGKSFTQRSVISDLHVHLHCFTIDEASIYISNFGVFEAGSDIIALSIYLSQAGWEEVV